MKNLKSIIFYGNLRDDKHCFQACLKMVLKYYFPKKKYTFIELDRLTKHKKDKWTWQGAGLLALSDMGFEVVNIENLDYKKFSKQGEKYLKEIWTEEVFMIQKKFSDLAQEKKIAELLVKNKKISLINKAASLKDIENYFYHGYLVIVSVNPFVFEEKSGYSSHTVLITDAGTQHITFHDPGLPPDKNRRVTRKTFLKAMTPPHKQDTNLIALRKL